MKKIITSLLLLVGMANAENFYLGYEYLANVNYDESGVNKELSNPLISEPVFMSLHKDLLTAYKGN